MSRVRPAAVAGRFYPANAAALADLVDASLGGVAVAGPLPKALIVPHAGYVYSGPIAASAYATLRPYRHRIHRVVLLGPAHFVRVTALAISSADAFATPLGSVEIDDELRRRALALPQVHIDDRAHAREHSLEVQLPFLQRVLDRYTILPLVVGNARPDEVADVLEQVARGTNTLVVISSDLSHYHDYATATVRDRRTAEAIVARRSDDIGPEDACGVTGIRGVLELARRQDLGVRLLDLRNAGDTAGLMDEVVGYGAFALG